MYKVGLLALGLLAGVALTLFCDHALKASAQPTRVSPRAVHAAPHPYTGARTCTMTGADTVACDNGYRGRVL
jgi:hypothetical protein